MAFQLDTSGGVRLPVDKLRRNTLWSDLDRFTQGYVEALSVRLAVCPDTAHGTHRAPPAGLGVQPCARCGLPIDVTGGKNAPALRFSDLAPETLARIMEDCATYLRTRIPPFQGHDHGAWFWTERQVDHLPDLPPLTVILCDDGKVRFADQIAARPLAVAHG